MFNRSRRNLARWFTLSMGSILMIFAAVMFYLETKDRFNAFDRELTEKIRLMVASIEYRYQRGNWYLNLQHVPLLGSNSLPLDNNISYIRWYDAEGRLVQFIGTHPPDRLNAAPGFKTIVSGQDEEWLREVTFSVMRDGEAIGYIQLATSLQPVQQFTKQLQFLLSIGVPVALGAIALTGWYLGGLAMQPIRHAYEQLQRFTADASHELRAPLSAMLSNAQVGLLTPPGDTSQQRVRLEKIVELAKGMSHLVSQLLFLSRTTRVLSPKTLKEIDIVYWLQKITEEYSGKLEDKSLELIRELPQESVILKAEPDLLRQAIINLLDNAGKYAPEGGTIHVRVLAKSGSVAIAVKDNGIGIPPEDLPHIFERFYRVDAARTRTTGGFGLGLSIVEQIVQVHGGKLLVTSVVGLGTTVTIELPVRG